VGPHDKPLPKPAFELTEKKLDPKAAAAKKPAARAKVRKTKAAASKKVTGKPSASTGPSTAKPAAAKAPAASLKAAQSSTSTIPKPSAAIAKQPVNPSPN
jgi:hypothetical protein